MKLIPGKPKIKPTDNSPRARLVEDVRTELYRLTTLVDELKARGTLEELDAASKILWGATRMLDATGVGQR